MRLISSSHSVSTVRRGCSGEPGDFSERCQMDTEWKVKESASPHKIDIDFRFLCFWTEVLGRREYP